MRKSLPFVIFSPVALVLFQSACGTEGPQRLLNGKSNILEAVAEKPNPVLVSFTLPDRTARPEYAGINGYYFKLLGEGADCPSGELIEEVGTWDDANREMKFKVNGKCSYSVTMRLGVYQESTALALQGPISFQNDIKPIMESQCVSCHETYIDYNEVKANGEMILREIEAKTMPMAAPLSDADIAKFLAWKDNGYTEKSVVALPSEKEKQLTKIYYQNNKNDYLMAYEMLSRVTIELRRSLWIQADGEAAGLTAKEIATYDQK